MIEVYEGEPEITFVVNNDYVIESIRGYQTLFNEYSEPQTVETALTYTSTPIGLTPVNKELVVNVSDLSQWPTPFSVHLTFHDNVGVKVIKSYYNVVQPYASISAIVVSGGIDVSDTASINYKSEILIRDMESVARTVIESYTGRNFGRSYGARTIDGTDRDRLYSSEHFSWVGAVSVEGGDVLYQAGASSTVEISPSGHLLFVKDGGEFLGFPEGYRYRVAGIFGENSVPYDVELAAKMLTIHYLCESSAQQNQYVDQIKFGESATRVNRLAFAGTGLMAVDRLLEKYRVGRFRVL
jgi:hypothetical protein